MTSSPPLAHLVREGRWSTLEEAWTEMILESPDFDAALGAVRAAAQKKEIPRCVSLVREQASLMLNAGEAAEAAELLGETMMLGGSPGELSTLLYQASKAAWGEDRRWAPFVEIAGFHENTHDMRAAWKAFKKLLSIGEGRVVYHAKGWGLGTIVDTDVDEREAKVRFASGRSDRFPFQTAIDIFEFLDEDDLRCLVVNDPDALKKRLKNEPLDVLTWILRRNGGKVNQAGIKLAMGTLGVDGARFTAWWRKTRKEAEASEWFELSGPAQRVQVRLLDVASDPAVSMKRQLLRAKTLGEALTRVRGLVAGGVASESVVNAALETLDELLEQDVDHRLTHRLGTLLFLRDQRGTTPELLHEMFAEAAEIEAPGDPSQPPELWALFQHVSGSREQEKCIELLPEILGDQWLEVVAAHLHHAAPGMARPLVDALEAKGRTPELIEHYKNLLARPTRNPILLIRLAEHLEDKDIDDQLPPPLRRVQCLLQLAVHVYKNSAGDTILTRARARLSEALTKGETPLLRRLLAGANVDELRNLASMLESGVDRDIDRLFTHIAIELSPTIFRSEEGPFWDSKAIWTTRAGLAKKEEELRVLRDVKIPANAEAIGKAASYGDLSENSEWEAAIEEQRNLTNRAMEVEQELLYTQLLENAPIPDDTVAPGTRVRYRDVKAGTEHVIDLLGPWDIERDGQVSYRSPLGAGMLGKSPGDDLSIELPSGRISIEILAVEPLDL